MAILLLINLKALMRFYRFSDKAIRQQHLSLPEQLMLFIRSRHQDGMAVIIDPYRKVLYGDCMKVVSTFDRSDLEKLNRVCGIDGDFVKDSYYTEIDPEEVFSGRYFTRFTSPSFVKANLDKYEHWANTEMFPPVNVVRFNANDKNLVVTNEWNETVRSIHIENTFVNRYYDGVQRHLDYSDEMHWVGLMRDADLDMIEAEPEKSSICIFACVFSSVIVQHSETLSTCISTSMRPCYPNGDGTFHNTCGVDFEASISADLAARKTERAEVQTIISNLRTLIQ